MTLVHVLSRPDAGRPADRACSGRCHAPIKSHRDIPDRRRATQQKEVRPTGRQPQRESARRPVGTISTAPFFFQIHDPTTNDRQGNDFGSSYRSEIFYTSDEQRQVAEDTIADVDRLRPVARQSGDRDQRGRPLLGGRGRAPGLPPAHPERLHLPLPPAGLEAATPRDRRLTGLKRYAGVRWTLDTACPGSARNRQSFSSLFALP
jgi:hypothetical protein